MIDLEVSGSQLRQPMSGERMHVGAKWARV